MSEPFTGQVKNTALAAPLHNVTVTLESVYGEEIEKTQTDQEGTYILSRVPEKGYVSFNHKNYVEKSLAISKLKPVTRLLKNRIVGYQDKLTFIPGETVDVYIHSSEGYNALLYRHGEKKECMWQSKDLPAKIQEVPDSNFVADGLDWKTALSYKIPEQAMPGIYSLLLRTKSIDQNPFAIPMVVSTPSQKRGQSKYLVLCSTNNWQTYNIWGGRSRYRNFELSVSDDYMSATGILAELSSKIGERLPNVITSGVNRMLGREKKNPEWVFHPLSIRRPHTNCALEGDDVFSPFTNHLAAGEWRVLAWLEQQKIPYEVATGWDLHKNPDLLQHYDAVILSTHCEYWSKAMYDGLKKHHRHSGLWIVNLSGNSIYREVDFLEDGSIRCLSTKFHKSVEDETQLIGVRFTESDYGTCAPYQVQRPEHWVFESCRGIAKNKEFGDDTLNRWTDPKTERYDPGRPGLKSGLQGIGASGWETDKLSATAPPDFIRVAKGQNQWGGADMVVREPAGHRGGVFSASSITFGGSLLVDDVCSQIVRNVLEKALSS